MLLLLVLCNRLPVMDYLRLSFWGILDVHFCPSQKSRKSTKTLWRTKKVRLKITQKRSITQKQPPFFFPVVFFCKAPKKLRNLLLTLGIPNKKTLRNPALPQEILQNPSKNPTKILHKSPPLALLPPFFSQNNPPSHHVPHLPGSVPKTRCWHRRPEGDTSSSGAFSEGFEAEVESFGFN